MFGMCTSIGKLEVSSNSNLNDNTKTLAFTMAVSQISISENYDSIFGRWIP